MLVALLGELINTGMIYSSELSEAKEHPPQEYSKQVYEVYSRNTLDVMWPQLNPKIIQKTKRIM